MKIYTPILAIIVTAASLQAAEYHVSTNGLDQKDAGSKSAPFRTISAAANIAQPGDVITVHEGTYREQVNPPRGGTSDEQRIVYQAAPGERVVVKGSEIIKTWKKVSDSVWKVTLPNSVFGDYNPYTDVIGGEWYKTPKDGLNRHTGAVYLNGTWLTEAPRKEDLFSSKSTSRKSGALFNIAWLQTVGYEKKRVAAVAMLNSEGIKRAPSKEGGECIGFIDDGDWANYDIDFGESTEHIEFRIASQTDGGIIEIRLGSPEGKLLAACAVPGTKGWQSWRTIRTPVNPISGKHTVHLAFKAPQRLNANKSYWFAEVDEQSTTIWAQFKTLDPNQETVEINMRHSVFYPDQPGRNYITVRGFTMRHAATPWSGAMSNQIGLIGTHWSKGWVIENNVISHSMNTGITLGCFELEGAMPEATAEGYVEYLYIALEKKGWSKATIGSHVVRNNHVSHCEKNGIHGSLGGIFSTIEGNTVCDIGTEGWISGPDVAGLKLLASNDVLIKNNHFYRCMGFGGLWLDWMAQGTRVTGNLFHENKRDLFVEVNHGPFLVDNNIFLSPFAIWESSQGGAYAHNLIAGEIRLRGETRVIPYFKPHTIKDMKLATFIHGDERHHNNLIVGYRGLSVYGKEDVNIQAVGNVFLAGAKPSIHDRDALVFEGFNPHPKLKNTSDGWWLEMAVDPFWTTATNRAVVTTELLGRAIVPDQAFENPDGSPLRLDTDYFGEKRNSENPAPGPFRVHDGKTIHLKAWPKAGSEEPAERTPTRSYAPQEAVEAWKDLRFGMFIHWGPVALTGHEIGWSRGSQTPIEEYDNLYKRFNPEHFDADEWVRVAKAAGMKYMVLTTKHHDGFCLWPSEYTDYDIGESPFKRDVVGELAEACRKGGIGFGTYYSVCDWWHPLYPGGGRAGTEDKPTGDMDKYIEYLQNQTAELIKNYGPLTTMWFDVPRNVKWYHNEPTLEMMRKLQPDLVVNNRAYYDKEVADFETPEQNLGNFNRERPWETCMTIARQWAWKPNDSVKSLKQCLHGLIYSAGGDGNFLFNVGPNALGEIEPEQIQRLEEMGEWIDRYSAGIHATRGGPFKPSGWGASTHKGNDIYLFIARWPAGGIHKLPMVGTRILKAENLSGKTVELQQTLGGYEFSIPESDRDPVATVIKLSVDKPASSIVPMDMGTVTGSLAFRKPSSSSSIRWNQQSQGPQQAFDDNPGSHWVPAGKEEEWIAVDLEKPQTVDSVKIQQYAAHLKELSLQFEQDGEWKTVFTETNVTGGLEKTFEPVTAQKFRLLLQGGSTHLSELQMFNIKSGQ